jgi:sugar phosphate isomerase/epimerase
MMALEPQLKRSPFCQTVLLFWPGIKREEQTMTNLSRRRFLELSGVAGFAATACTGTGEKKEAAREPLFKISLAEWSFHRTLFGGDPGEMMGWGEFERRLQSDQYRSLLGGSMNPLDFAATARRDYDIDAIEYVNVFFFDRAKDPAYIGELKKRADSEGVKSVLIMCDGLGQIGHPEEPSRLKTVENHFPWVEAAAFLGCHSIRVNAASDPQLPASEQQKLAADGLRRLGEFADARNVNVLVENHGGLSSDGKWLSGVMKLAGHPRVGTLPDFGNFDIREGETYDRYVGVQELMPFAKSVSAKSHEFDSQGNETRTDFTKMMKIVLDAGFRGYVGIEYEGTKLSEPDGIRATKDLLVRVRDELSREYS